MTTPSVLPPNFDGTDTDFSKTQGVDRRGAARIQQNTVTIPAATAANEYVGLIPFNKGARFNIQDKSVYVESIDSTASVTLNLGYVYDDDATFTNNPTAWVAGDDSGQAGGFLTITNEDGIVFVAEADGWLAAQILTAATDTEADITFNIVQAYDG